MPLPVSLQSVVDSLSWHSDESSTYLHKPTGEIVTIDHSLLRRVEVGDVDVEPDADGEAAGRSKGRPPMNTINLSEGVLNYLIRVVGLGAK